MAAGSSILCQAKRNKQKLKSIYKETVTRYNFGHLESTRRRTTVAQGEHVNSATIKTTDYILISTTSPDHHMFSIMRPSGVFPLDLVAMRTGMKTLNNLVHLLNKKRA